MATLKEIAALAKVSITTVSRTINFDNTLSISDEKKRRIFEIVEELEYKTPRRKKREMKPKLNIILAYWYTVVQEIDDPYYLSIRQGIERVSNKYNINVIKIPKRDNQYQIDTNSDIDGIIAVGRFTEEETKTFKTISDNIVFVDYSPQDENFDSIVIDFEKSMRKIMNYIVVEKGYTEVGYLGGKELIKNKDRINGDPRETYFKEYMNNKNIYNSKFVFVDQFSSMSGYEMVMEAHKNSLLPKAFFAASDSIAIGAIKAIHELKLSIPEDIAIVGFNDIPTALYTFPPLTTLRIPTEFMGEKAVDLIMENINGRDVNIQINVATKLIKRGTI